MKDLLKYRYTGIIMLLIIGLVCCLSLETAAQERQVIQVKAFTEGLKPYPNAKISIDGGAYIALNEKGTAYANILKEKLPIQSITLSDSKLEVASWNFTKGILEITIRNKSYQDVSVKVINQYAQVIPNLAITYKGEKTVRTKTDSKGFIRLPLALDEKINRKQQFLVENYQVLNVQYDRNGYLLELERIKPAIDQSTFATNEQESIVTPTIDRIAIDTVESVKSLYALIRKYPLSEMDIFTQNLVDDKFNTLLLNYGDSIRQDSSSYIQKISDTTYVAADLENLLREAKKEGQRITVQKSTFDKKIALVKDKLNVGFENLEGDAREELLSDINLLENILASNQSTLVDNQQGYQDVINELRNRFFDMEALEGKLSQSEEERLKEKKVYNQRIFAISVIGAVFAALLILMLYLSLRLKKQQKQLVKANKAVQTTNENLELLVHERTEKLEETFKELDMVLYKASHDLRAPVCSISGLSYLIKLNTGDNELVELIDKTNSDMDKLLKQLSAISEIHQPGKFREIKVCETTAEIRDRFKEQIQRKNIQFNLDCPKGLKVVTIKHLLEVIVFNLIENALYFTEVDSSKASQVSVTVAAEENQLLIDVLDNGIGIQLENRKALFDMFYRGTEFSVGNGLGLYIVQKAIDVLGGSIEVDSEPNEFARFTVKIPVDESAHQAFDFLETEEKPEMVS